MTSNAIAANTPRDAFPGRMQLVEGIRLFMPGTLPDEVRTENKEEATAHVPG
jgi:hypothetical protein